MKQNVTLSIEKEIIKKGKVVAARKDTSISKMLADLLKSMVENDERYEAAKRSTFQLLKKGFHLGGKSPGSEKIYMSDRTFADTNILVYATMPMRAKSMPPPPKPSPSCGSTETASSAPKFFGNFI